MKRETATMRVRSATFLLLNAVGGMAVLGSYVLWIGSPAHDGQALWGSLGPGARTLYTVSMFTAAAGYFAVLNELLRHEIGRLSEEQYARLQTIFCLILFPSALWMPLTYLYLAAPSAAAWWAMRATLFVVAGASFALVAFLVGLRGTSAPRAHQAAIVGSLAFTFQTGVLDAFVWPLFFPG
jgi:hypothetical protein